VRPVLTMSATLLNVLAAAAAHADSRIDLCDFKPAFMEDFKDISIASRILNGKRWIAHTPSNEDFGDADFTDPGPNGPFSLKDGALQITARRNRAGRWFSGLIAAADSSGKGYGVQYGYFEARMRMPPGPGTWPAFWLEGLPPANSPAPGIEIDVVEYYGQFTDAYQSALHVWDKGVDRRPAGHDTQVRDGALVSGYHDYGVQVEPDMITYYFDRSPVWSQPTPPEHRSPLFPLVDLALGSGYPIDKTPDPSVLSVKYVHVYAHDDAGRSLRCPR
jgi:beta-glucanase (GH16 family)